MAAGCTASLRSMAGASCIEASRVCALRSVAAAQDNGCQMAPPTLRTSFSGASLASAQSQRFQTALMPRGLGFQHQRGRRSVVRTEAVASPVQSPFQQLDGFTQLGQPVPEELTIQDIVKTLPREVFEIDDAKAWGRVATTVAAVAVGYAAIAYSPWYLLPLVYVYMSAAITGLFVIGHDCGHNSFSNNQLINDIVGTLVFMPLIYPFEPWRIKHNTHHAHTNKLIVDTAWQPFQTIQYDKGGPVARFIFHATMGPLWFIGSVGHWFFWHFSLDKFRPQDRTKVYVSWAACAVAFFGGVVPLTVYGGPVALLKFFILPWLGFHFWMSTFTLVHHTAPHIPFKHQREWNAAQAQLGGTVHCEYPKWIEFLCHDISVHIPHHLSTRIPSYNLRPAYEALQQNWDKYLNKAEFGVPLMKLILSECNLFDTRKKKYVKFNKSERV